MVEKEFTVKSNPAYYGAGKIYRGYDFIGLLQQHDTNLDLSSPFQIEVTTLDGWKAPKYSSDLLIKNKAFLAYRESKKSLTKPVSEDKLWSLVVTKKKTLYPGPYYLVWNDLGKNPDIMPLQVATIRVLQPLP